MGDSDAPPRVIATVGLHGSASTWVFNIVREAAIAALGPDSVLAVHAEEMGQVPDAAGLGGRCLVLKSHHGSPGFGTWLDTVQPPVILSIRDPRDAAISMALRFKVPLHRTVRWIARDCEWVVRLASRAHVLLRYEQRFFEDRGVAAALVQGLGLRLDAGVIDAIFARYSLAATRDFTRDLARLPAGRLVVEGDFVMDSVTRLHRSHIGDAESGKWLELPAQMQGELAGFFAGFLQRFGYET